MKLATFALAVAGVLSLAALAGCSKDSFCFDQCAGEDGGGGTGNGGTGGIVIDFDAQTACDGDACASDAPVTSDACVPAPDGREICNGKDDDCDGKIDEAGTPPEGIDFTAVRSCGTCDNDCTLKVERVEEALCTGVTDPGFKPGICDYTKCEPDSYDIDQNKQNGCEYYCPWNPDGTNTTDPGGEKCGRDDDCDGKTDEDVGLCDDVLNCGKCGYKCVIPNGTPKCETTATQGQPCTFGPQGGNTHCKIAACNTGFYDIDGKPENGCEYDCPTKTTEVCDGKDNDCDGLVDFADSDLAAGDPAVGKPCYGGTQGECAAVTHQGVTKCIGGAITCCDQLSANNPPTPECNATTGPQVQKPNEVSEICNGLDDDCDGSVDDAPIDVGGVCGSGVGACKAGTFTCTNGVLACQGEVKGTTETCNGLDDDCDGAIDGTVPPSPIPCTTDVDCAAQATAKACVAKSSNPADKACVVPAALPSGAQTGPCNVPTPPPAGVPQPCKAGVWACVASQVVCVGSVGPQAATDKCGEDTNCDGTLSSTVDLQNDIQNCGACGNDCNKNNALGHGIWACQAGQCVRTGCEASYIDCDTNANDCERLCTFTSSTELCNGADDNCDCFADNNPPAPSAVQVCGVAAGASAPGCTSGVSVACQNGAWKCTFPTGYCGGGTPPSCATTQDVCDGVDNNCNGIADEPFLPPVKTQGYVGQPCTSDEGMLPPGHGACQTTGTYTCNGPNATKCSATINLNAAGPELCDGKDNDCDSVADEPYTSKGTNPTYYVKPDVTRIGTSLWMFQYEASRAGSTATNPGTGNGYQTTAPAGNTVDKTQACSVPNVLPWFNVTAQEASQTCLARGGRLCTLAEWQSACRATVACTWGYAPRGAPCTTAASGTKFCNLAAFDFLPGTAGDQDGLLPTASSALQNCWADWSGLQGNPANLDDLRDMTGNLRELTQNGTVYTLMGGAFNSQDEDGASCDNVFYSVDSSFKLYDMGFRCCFDTSPL